ncbi:non-ribosomal peptide synthetase [Micromonospora sp. WMMD1120]|uniref:non-ribosomal peptide synthetase n=1 Tax=Micromonospora sp. WMMD1120 TaxID=3016106 RepID=UPI0024164731|nr:non-ribosomal peptide synthetase [Micromonospora sp. WMMD1120]MDG4810902.1 non-ribosomal peptide synthetase [Micromonospora sp. WMMD1120]
MPDAVHADLSDSLVHEAIAARAAATPDALAVRSRRRWLTHRQLDELVRNTQRALTAVAVPGDRPSVVVVTSRSEWAVVAMLGVWRAGGVYVPLNEAISEQRLRTILEQVRPGAILTDSRNAASLRAAWPDCPVLDVEQAAADRSEPASAATPGRPAPHDLACLVYTSGSSGQPKGVMIEHASLYNLVAAVASPYAPGPEHHALHFGALGWDSSIEEMILPLFCGTPLTICTDEADYGVPHFLRELAEQSISHLYLPTAYWRELCLEFRGGSERLPGCVRSVLIGGERASADDLAVWRDAVPAEVDLWNCYGLTETCVTSTIYRDDRSVPADRFPSMPLGGPCPTVTTQVLDDELRPVPTGSVGELVIGGPGVGAGYWNDPDGTAAAFIPDRSGARRYRTGDLGMVDEAGRLHFVGRVDRQVKINGFRVNPSEIEGVLTAHPAVHRACVVSRREASGHAGLVAFLELADASYDVEQVREHLAGRVPAFMMPASVVVLDAMPLLSSGKIDVDALTTRAAAAGGVVTGEPADDGHAAEMTKIWCQALGIDECGPNADLLELGGNSLSGMRIAARVSEHFGVTIRFRDVLENRTPAALVQYVERLRSTS